MWARLAQLIARRRTPNDGDDALALSGTAAGRRNHRLTEELTEDAIIRTGFERADVAAAFKRFAQLDADDKGFIMRDDLYKLPELRHNPLADRVVAQFEDEGDGLVTFTNFIEGAYLFSLRCPAGQRLRVMFRIHDFDGDGVISPQDLAAYLLRVAQRAQAGAQQPPEGEAGGAGTGGAPGDDEEAGKVPDAPGAGVEVKADDDEQAQMPNGLQTHAPTQEEREIVRGIVTLTFEELRADAITFEMFSRLWLSKIEDVSQKFLISLF